MFQTGDYVLHGSDGICTVLGLCASPMGDGGTYYLLEPVEGPRGSRIYTPTENGRVKMRRIMTRAEADALIDRIPSITALEIPVEKHRKETYRNAMLTCDPVEYVRIIKTVYRRRESLANTKRRLSESDTTYDRSAKQCLYRELSLSLGVAYEKVEEFLTAEIERRLEA